MGEWKGRMTCQAPQTHKAGAVIPPVLPLLLVQCVSASMCLTHSDAKHTKTSEFGAGKGLLQGHARRWMLASSVLHALKSPKLSGSVSTKHFFKIHWRQGIEGL